MYKAEQMGFMQLVLRWSYHHFQHFQGKHLFVLFIRPVVATFGIHVCLDD